MGDLYRRFWLPVLISEELPAPDCTPVQLTVLCERLVAFKDSNGRIGVLEERCPHRQALLFWGRNEEAGLRCVYHGWKFDVEGNCLEIPNAPEGEVFREKIRAYASYPAVERGGLIWVYMGPPETRPPLPDFELNDVPASHRYISKMFIGGNWMQGMEGDIDSSHVSFLHSRVDNEAAVLLASNRLQTQIFADKTPKWFIKDTDYGVMLAARSGFWKPEQIPDKWNPCYDPANFPEPVSDSFRVADDPGSTQARLESRCPELLAGTVRGGQQPSEPELVKAGVTAPRAQLARSPMRYMAGFGIVAGTISPTKGR